MLLSFAAGAAPIFLTKNYFDRHARENSDIIASTGQDFVHRLIDMDPKSYWVSQGSSDAITETITFGLWLPNGKTLREVDTILIQNHNIKGLTVETSADGGATYTTRFTSAAVTDANTRINQAALYDVDTVRITMTTTQTANAEKQIGDIIVAAGQLQASIRPNVYRRKAPRVGHKSAEMADRSIRRAYIFWSDASYHQFEATFGFTFIPAAERTTFRDLLLGFEPLIMLPEPGDEQADVILGQVVPESYIDDWMAPSHSGDYAISFDFQGVGGA